MAGTEDGNAAFLIMLLADIRDIFEDRVANGQAFKGRGEDLGDRLFSEEIIEHLHKCENRPWAEFGRARKPLTKTGLASILKALPITPVSVRKHKVLNGYNRTQFEDAFARYLPPITLSTTVAPLQAAENRSFAAESQPLHANGCNGCESPSIPQKSAIRNGVRVQEALQEEKSDPKGDDSPLGWEDTL